jgi:transposase-like protein
MKKYDDEFKQNAVKKTLDGQSVASVARELGVGEGLLHKWKRARLTTASDAEREVIELRKKLCEVAAGRAIY